MQQPDGVSIIIPTHQGADRILSALDSISNQVFPDSLIEVIVIPNGPDDGTYRLVDAWKKRSGELAVVLTPPQPAGVSAARNTGLALATRQYITFLDDDDTFEPCYLERLYRYSEPNVVILGQLTEYSGSYEKLVTGENTVSRMRHRIGKASAPIYHFPWALGLNACKLIPAHIATSISYPDSLRSGEDVVYMSQLLKFSLTIRCAPSGDKCSYQRLLRQTSVSRQHESFDFSVRQRLDVVSHLISTIDALDSQDQKMAVQSLIYSQLKPAILYMQSKASNSEFEELQEMLTINNLTSRKEVRRLTSIL